MTETTAQKSSALIWIQAVRAFSFTASIIPCILGAMLALLFSNGAVLWYLLPFIIISALFLHAGTNLVSDYFDYLKGVDTKDSMGSSGVLVAGLLKPKQIFNAGIFFFFLALLVGLPVIFARGEIIIYLGLIGILGGFFYTGWPIGYKYLALGDFFVFALMGPLMVIGTFYALTGTFHPTVLYTSLPIGFLVTGILQANNLRDIAHDRKANVKTLAGVMGSGFAKAEYLFLIAGAYLIVIALVIFKILEPWSLLVLLSLPPAIKNLTLIKGIGTEDTAKIAMLDVMTAQLHLLFGLLLSISLVLSKFL
ncbi:MAG: 1,4-dihydroxy-2-naphthoate octaprenyltransferase [Ignavibacteria bacterium]